MFATHREVGTYADHVIYQRLPGFEFTPIMLGKIASYLVQAPDGKVTVVAFLYSLLAELEGPIDEARLLAAAVQQIHAAIDEGQLGRQCDRTFEYHGGQYVEVNQPRWWISTFP